MNLIKSTLVFMSFFALAIVFVYAEPEFAVAQNGCQIDPDPMDPDQCDDMNDVDNDGCTDCMTDPGYTCNNLPLPNGPSICRLGCQVTVVKEADPAFNTEFDFLRVTFPFLRPKIVDQFTLADSANPVTTFEIPFFSLTFLTEINLPPGWELFDILCDNPEISGDGLFLPQEFPQELINLGLDPELDNGKKFAVLKCLFSGEYTCTARNFPIEGQTCNIEVTEVLSSGSFNTEFPFRLTAGDPENPPLDETFDLMRNQSRTEPDLPLSSLYTITQDTPEGFTLDSIECSGDADFNYALLLGEGDENEGTVQVTCNSPGNVNCTFVNSPIVIRNIPTMSEWGLIATAAVLGIAGILYYRRRMLRA